MDEKMDLTNDAGTGVINFDEETLDTLEKEWDGASSGEEKPEDRDETGQSYTLKHLDEASKNLKESTQEKTPEQQDSEKRQEDIREFVAEYGTTLDPKAIPSEVWTSVAKGKSLLSAYQSWENRQLKEENSTLKKSNENKARSTGSRETAGTGRPQDPIEADWNKND